MKLIIDIPEHMYINAKSDIFSDILGHWIWNVEKGYCKCSKCGIGMGHTEFDYCPNCGCRMVEPQEREG